MQPRTAYLNAVGTAVPANEVHGLFTAYAPRLLADARAAGCSSGWPRAPA